MTVDLFYEDFNVTSNARRVSDIANLNSKKYEKRLAGTEFMGR